MDDVGVLLFQETAKSYGVEVPPSNKNCLRDDGEAADLDDLGAPNFQTKPHGK